MSDEETFNSSMKYIELKSEPEKTKRTTSTTKTIKLQRYKGLFSVGAVLSLISWYLFSGITLFLNKYILSYMNGDPIVLGVFQITITTICGLIQIYIPCKAFHKPRVTRPPGFYKHMILVGCARFLTVMLNLISMNYVAVSFTETVKSSSPIFTVIISWLMLGEPMGLYVNLSLVPVVTGLALCSANELSFNSIGFTTALTSNIAECVQNVYSKMLISGEKYRCTPAELQFYASIASVVLQVPAMLWLVDGDFQKTIDKTGFLLLLLNGFCFHCHSITAYVLMDYISPVTHSVANTVKRAALIWLSVLIFNNSVTALSAVGTITVVTGVTLYNKAQQYDATNRQTKMSKDDVDATLKIRSI